MIRIRTIETGKFFMIISLLLWQVDLIIKAVLMITLKSISTALE